jgi:hypothetical protein
VKYPAKRMKMQTSEWEKICENNRFNGGFEFRIQTELSKLNSKRKIITLENQRLLS